MMCFLFHPEGILKHGRGKKTKHTEGGGLHRAVAADQFGWLASTEAGEVRMMWVGWGLWWGNSQESFTRFHWHFGGKHPNTCTWDGKMIHFLARAHTGKRMLLVVVATLHLHLLKSVHIALKKNVSKITFLFECELIKVHVDLGI